MKPVEALSLGRNSLQIALFSLLMFLGSCPPWFLGLLMAVALLQLSGWLFIKIHHADQSPAGASPLVTRWNGAAQLAWIGLITVQLAIQFWFPEAMRFSAAFLEAGYATLAALQIVAFYHLFCQYRPVLFADALTAS